MCLLVIHSLFPRVLLSCLIGLSLPLSKIRVPFISAMFHFGSAPKVLGCFHPKILIRISTCHFVPTGWLLYRHPDMPSGLHHNPSHHNVRSNECAVVVRRYLTVDDGAPATRKKEKVRCNSGPFACTSTSLIFLPIML